MGTALGRLAPATTLADAEAMRLVRNECRMFMTKDTHEISQAEQELWWATLEHSTTRPFIYLVGMLDDISDLSINYTTIGYGLIRQIDRKWWISGGLLPKFRGQGHGKLLFGALADIVNKTERKPCWLEVRASNTAARRLYMSLGFQTIKTDDEGLVVTITMKRDRS